jgi:hypothetical protein
MASATRRSERLNFRGDSLEGWTELSAKLAQSSKGRAEIEEVGLCQVRTKLKNHDCRNRCWGPTFLLGP